MAVGQRAKKKNPTFETPCFFYSADECYFLGIASSDADVLLVGLASCAFTGGLAAGADWVILSALPVNFPFLSNI